MAVVLLTHALQADAGSLGPWGLAPASSGSGQSARPFFDYSQPAGGTIHDALAIFNLGDYPLTYDLYTADGYNLGNGAFALRGRTDTRTDIGAWTTLSVPVVSVPPHEKALVPFTISVPLNVTPGDHAGGIVALMRPATVPASAANQVETRQGVGARIYLRVPGDLRPSVAVIGLNADEHSDPFGGGHARLRAVIVNTGNTRIDGMARIEATGLFGARKALPPLHLDSLLPGSRVEIARSWPGLAFAGPYKFSISVASSSVRTNGATTVWVMPWGLLLTLVLIVAALVSAWYARRRRGRASHGELPGEPVSPGGGNRTAATVGR